MKQFTKLIGSSLALFAALLALVAWPSPAAAGGWVVVSLDESAQLVAGESTDVGFTVLRHGVTPETSDDLELVVTGSDGTSERFAAVPDGPPGHHVATVTLDAGDYTWSVTGAVVSYQLGSVEVASSASGSSWLWDVGQWGGLGVAVALGGLAAGDLVRRRRAQPAAA